MAKGKCKAFSDTVSIIEAKQRRSEDFYTGHPSQQLKVDTEDRTMLEKVVKWLHNKFQNKPNAVKEKHINQAIESLYGAPDLRKSLQVKLQSILKANPGIEDMIQKYLIQTILLMGDKAKVKILPDKSIQLSSLPVSILKTTIKQAEDIIASGYGENLGKGIIGTLDVQLSTARKVTKRDKTGALNTMRQAVRDFPMEQGRMIKKFTSADIGVKGGRNYGMDDILQAISRLTQHESLGNYSFPNIENIMFHMFSKYIQRDYDGNRALEIDDDGNITLATEWAPVEHGVDGKGNKIKVNGSTVQRWKAKKDGTSDIKFGYKKETYQTQEEYYGSSGNIIPMNADMIKVFKEQAERFEKLHQEVWDFLSKEQESTQAELVDLLKTLVPSNWSVKDIKDLFFEKNPAESDRWGELSLEQQQLVYFIHQNASRYQIFKPFVFNGTDVNSKQREGRQILSLPIIYNKFKFPFMYESAIEDFKWQLKQINKVLDNPELSPKDRRIMLNERKNLQSKISRAVFILDKIDGLETEAYPVDTHNGTRVVLGADTKHMEHISNAFDVLEGRTDKGVYYSYLKHNFSQLQRAKLAIKMIQALQKAKSDEVQDVILNWYKVAMYMPDAKSGIGPFSFSSEDVADGLSRLRNLVPGLKPKKVHAHQIDRVMRSILSYFSGNLLKGTTTAVQNYTAIIEKLTATGIDSVKDAYDVIAKGGKDLEQIIALSGVVDFREFFSRSLTNDAQTLGVENKEMLALGGAMAKYWYKVKQLKKRYKGKQLNDKIEALREQLRQDYSYVLDRLPSEERITARMKTLRAEHRNNILRKYVDYAINKEYEAAEYLQDEAGYKVLTKAKQSIAGFYEWYAKMQRENVPTMGKTEAELRTLSFVIGVRKAMKMGLIPQKPIAELTGDDLNWAITIGRDFTEMMDFGLSRQDLGQIGHSNIGAFVTQFKVWSMQKFASDLDKVIYAAQSVADDKTNNISLKTIAKLAELTLRYKKYPTKALRVSNPRVATFRTWIATQGIWTAMWDIALLGPLAAPGIRQFGRMLPLSNPFFRAIGGSTSDLISLALAPITISIFLSAGEGEDAAEKITDYFLRKTFLGFGGKWIFDWLLLPVWAALSEDDPEVHERVIRQIYPTLPPGVKDIGLPGYELVRKRMYMK